MNTKSFNTSNEIINAILDAIYIALETGGNVMESIASMIDAAPQKDQEYIIAVMDSLQEFAAS